MSQIFAVLPKALVIVLFLGHLVIAQDNNTAEVSPTEATKDSTTEAPPAGEEALPANDEKPPSASADPGQTVGQSLIPGLPSLFPGLSPASNPFSILSLLFPTLATLTSMQLPGMGMLGAPLSDQQTAASKVVLVLAEDRDDPAKSHVQNKQIERVARQSEAESSPMRFDQLVGQAFSPDAISQALSNFGTGAQGEGLLGQSLSPESIQQIFAQTFAGDGGLLGQALNTFSGQSGGGILGQPLTQVFGGDGQAGAGLLGQPLGQAFGGDGQEGGDILGQSLSQVLGRGDGEDQSGGDGLLSQAFAPIAGQQLTQSFAQFIRQIPGLQQVLNRGSGSVGAPQSDAAPADDASAQTSPSQSPQVGQSQQTQPTGESPLQLGRGFQLNGFRNFLVQNIRVPWATANTNALEAQASEISEVHVKPEFTSKTAANDYSDDKMANMKFKAALKEALLRKSAPILWFRMPPQQQNYRAVPEELLNNKKSPEELVIEAKLKAFERQVITELKQLQEIVRHAKEMRAAAKGNAKTTKDSPYKLSYPLSKIPVHKITHEDIEKALKDEYVRKSLQKAIQQRLKSSFKNSESQEKYSQTGLPTKRQTMINDQKPFIKQVSKEDVVKMLAYAYRMAVLNEMARSKGQGERTMNSSNRNNDDREQRVPDQRQWIDQQQSMMPVSQTQTQKFNENNQNEERQWMEEKMKQQKIQEQRQWAEQQNPKAQQLMQKLRQWADQQNPHPQPQMQGPRQWADQQNSKAQVMQDQRQTAEQQSLQFTQGQSQKVDQQNPQLQQQMEEQRQRAEQQSSQTHPQMQEQRQWAEQQNSQKKPEQRQVMTVDNMQRQRTLPQTKQIKWIDEKINRQMESDQRQWAEQQTSEQKTEVPQITGAQQQRQQRQEEQDLNAEQRQWAEMKRKSEEETQQRQWVEQQKQDMMKQRQWTETNSPQIQQQPITTVDRQWIDQPMDLINGPMDMGMIMQSSPQIMRQMEDMQMINNPMDPSMFMQTMQDPHDEQQNREFVAEATPQMPENAGQVRHKDLFDDLSFLELGKKKKGNRYSPSPPTIINYYFGQGGSRYPVYTKPLHSSGGYGGGGYEKSTGSYGGLSESYGGSSGGYGSYGSGAAHHSGAYGGGGSGSNAYGSSDAYRSATGNDEIEEMLRQHQTLAATHFRK